MSDKQVIVSQALVCGRVTDQVSTSPVSRGLALELWYRPAPEGDEEPADYRPARLYRRVSRDGYFSFTASGGSVFGDRSPVPAMQFRLEVTAPGYQPLQHEFEMASDRLASLLEAMTLAGESRQVTRVAGPPEELDLPLSPVPLRLTGQVLLDGDPDSPMANAEITVTAPEARPAVTSDDEGFFAIDNLPLAREITLTLSDGSEEQEQSLVLDYRQPVNNQRLVFL